MSGDSGAKGVGSNASMDMLLDIQPSGVEDSVGESSEAQSLVYTHPEYLELAGKWHKYLDTYASRDVYRFIHRHLRESSEMFGNRVARGYYYNYVASVVDLYVSYLFGSPIHRQIEHDPRDVFAQLYDDADLAGTKYPRFMALASTFSQIHGHSLVLVDAPQLPEGGFTDEAARIRAKHRPYLSLFQAPQLLDWSLDKHGNFRWIKLEVPPEDSRGWLDEKDAASRKFLIWGVDHWEEWNLVEDEAEQVGEGPNPLGEVPIVVVRNVRDVTHPWMGLSSVRDIADINIAILNWGSLGDEEIFERCLNVLAMEKGEGDIPVALSHHNVLQYEVGANAPFYLEPGDTPLEMIGKWIERGKDEIFRLAKFGGTVGLQQQKMATSGIAYAFEFNETNQCLADKGQELEQAELKIHRLAAAWVQEEFQGSISYPDEYGVQDFLLELSMLADARATLTSGTAIAELEKRIVARMFSREGQKLRERIFLEVEVGRQQPAGFLESFKNIPPQLFGGPTEKPGGEGLPPD